MLRIFCLSTETLLVALSPFPFASVQHVFFNHPFFISTFSFTLQHSTSLYLSLSLSLFLVHITNLSLSSLESSYSLFTSSPWQLTSPTCPKALPPLDTCQKSSAQVMDDLCSFSSDVASLQTPANYFFRVSSSSNAGPAFLFRRRLINFFAFQPSDPSRLAKRRRRRGQGG